MRYVVLEEPGRAPVTITSAPTQERAEEIARAVAWHQHLHGGTGKVTVMQAESTDQLQMSRRGPVRDQPELPATGQDLKILVPTVYRKGSA